MRTVPTPAGRAWTAIGLLVALVHLAWLSGIALFDNGALSRDWAETVPWILIVAMPAILAGAGFRNPPALTWAAGVSLPLALISLAGATLPLLLPAVCYLTAYLASDPSQTVENA
jgi:hypothetical protein